MSADELWKTKDRCEEIATQRMGTVWSTSSVYVDVDWDDGTKTLVHYAWIRNPKAKEKLDWEPAYGVVARDPDVVGLAKTLEMVRREVCAYNLGMFNYDVLCDCKYGKEEDTRSGSEQTGCPELREVIHLLLHKGWK